MSKKIFVLGGEKGYIGTKLVNYLKIVRPKDEIISIGRGIDVCCNYWETSSTDIIINAAGVGVKPCSDSERYVYDNVMLPWNLSKQIKGSGMKLIHLSSYFELFTTNLYAKSKAFASELLKDKPNVSTVYLYNVFGGIEYPNRIMAGIKNSIKNERIFVLTNPGACRSFVYIDHVLSGLNEVIDKPADVYHFTDGNKISMSGFVDDLYKEVRKHEIYFDYTMRDSGGYPHDCYTPKVPYFKKLPLMEDLVKDVKEYIK